MRKLLLASVATVGATLAMAGAAKAQPVKPVAPGTIVVHLHGYLQFEFGDYGSTYNTVTTSAGTDKLNPISTIGDFRIYPGFDAQTVNGIDYGAQAEIRTGYSDASVGQSGKPIITTSTSSSSISSLYVKRAYGYLGTPDYGYVRFGQTDSAFTLLQAGVIEAFGDGGQWTLEGGQNLLFPTNASPGGSNQFIYADQTAVYATDKIVYISPAYAGFNIVAGYEPNSNGLKEGYNNNSVASSTSGALSASNSTADAGKRRKNTFDAGVQYVLSADGVKYKASADLLVGQPIDYDGVAVPAVGTALHDGNYDALEVYQFGGQATFAGLTVGANIKGGQVEDGYAFKPRGARDAFAYIISASYVLGPYVLGASYFNSQSAGTYVPGLVVTLPTTGKKTTVGRTLSEYGLAVGANYVISPDLSLFTQYEYGHRHQLGNSSLDTTNTGHAQVQGISIGATIKW
jgi:hypothetical protein